VTRLWTAPPLERRPRLDPALWRSQAPSVAPSVRPGGCGPSPGQPHEPPGASQHDRRDDGRPTRGPKTREGSTPRTTPSIATDHPSKPGLPDGLLHRRRGLRTDVHNLNRAGITTDASVRMPARLRLWTFVKGCGLRLSVRSGYLALVPHEVEFSGGRGVRFRCLQGPVQLVSDARDRWISWPDSCQRTPHERGQAAASNTTGQAPLCQSDASEITKLPGTREGW
jgi:hypothetical protein